MATFTIDPYDSNFVIGPGGFSMPRASVDQADIAPAAPVAAPVAAPTATPAMTPAAQAVLAKRDAVLPGNGLVKTGSQHSRSVQKGVSAAQLDPILEANTKSTEALAQTVEQQGAAKSQRAAEGAERDLYTAQGTHATAEAEREDSRQRKEIARMNQLALTSQTDPEIDPDREVNSWSTGKKIGMAILGMLQGAFNNTNNQPGAPNQVIGIINDRINQDIAVQKEQIASGRLRRGNMVSYFREQGMNEEAAEKAAEARAWAMVERMALANKAIAGAPEAKEQADLVAQQMRQQVEQKNNELKLSLGTDRVSEQSTSTFARPQADAGGGLEAFTKQLSARKAYEEAGATPEQLSAFDAALGIPSPGGKSSTQLGREKEAATNVDQAKANAAHASLMQFATTVGLKTNPDTGKLERPSGLGLGWKLGKMTELRAARKVAVEALARLQTGAVISASEEATFKGLIGDDNASIEEIAINMNALDTLLRERLSPAKRDAPQGAPKGWE